jgi:hypothetical protein
VGNKLILCNPVGVASTSVRRDNAPMWAPGARLGLLFNNHVSSYRVWKRLEALVAERLGASEVVRVWKENTFAPAPPAAVRQLASGSDIAIVGVAA